MQNHFKSLSLRQKVGQLFFIGLPSREMDDEARQLLEEISPGGVCLFARNIREPLQVRTLLDDIRTISPVEPILSLDQEGGLVDRLRRIMTPMPSAQAISESGGVETVEELAANTAETVRRLGFNMNFAPVVDVVDEARGRFSNGLVSRAFGKTKEEVIEYAKRYLSVIQLNGCLGCIKHFPGLGASQVDSHDELPNVNISSDEFYQVDLEPYRQLLKTGQVHVVMVGHVAYPQLDLQETDSSGKLIPSSLSSKIIQNLLRKELGFDGLVITDDMEMGAIMKNYGMAEACKMAIRAGEDMLLICANTAEMREGFNAVLQAVEKGEISEDRIDESLQRIAKFKALMKPALPFDEGRLAQLSAGISELNTRLNYSYGG